MKSLLNIFSVSIGKRLFLLGFILVGYFNAYAQNNVQAVAKAMKQGDAKTIALYFDKQIDLTFSDKSSTYGKRQAEVILQKFFSKIEPSDFLNVQYGTSVSNHTRFAIGQINSNNGVYKVYLFFIQRDGEYLIRELRFEK
ncbi:MAG: DUF4783 domain-containing protein [Bacteroidetes bacterium]|nr:DUF4783 domain-containing protein [Bacteroidota bacterium]